MHPFFLSNPWTFSTLIGDDVDNPQMVSDCSHLNKANRVNHPNYCPGPDCLGTAQNRLGIAHDHLHSHGNGCHVITLVVWWEVGQQGTAEIGCA